MSADYRARKHGSSVTIQLSIKCDERSTRQDVQNAIDEKLAEGEDPPGFEIKIIDWRGNEQEDIDQKSAFRSFQKVLEAATFHIRPHRSAESKDES